MLPKIAAGILLMLLVFYSRFDLHSDEWIIEIPDGSQVTLDHREEDGTSFMDVSIVFGETGHKVSDWGTPTIIENNISVDAKIWDWTGWDYPMVITLSHTYTLGNLSFGKYLFTFKAWGVPIKNTTINIYVNATVDVYPETLWFRDRGESITAYTKLSEDYNVSTVIASTILMNDTIPVDPSLVSIEDYDKDGVLDLITGFNGTEVMSYVRARVNMSRLYEEKLASVTLTVTGYLSGDIPFKGSDTLTIILYMSSGVNKYIVPS